MIELYIHKPPMKSLLYAITRCYNLENAIKIVNKEYDLSITEENVIKWGHIPEEEALKKLNNERDVKVSDTTDSDSSTEADKQKN